MTRRPKQDERLRAKRIRDHVKVLEFLMDTNNLKSTATGGNLETPQKLITFYAGYLAMRRIWNVVKKDWAEGKKRTGDKVLDKELEKTHETDKTSIIYRIDKEIAHPLGLETSTLFRISKFKYWGKKFLKLAQT